MSSRSLDGPIPTFEVCFHALTGYNPMRWQLRFFKRMLSGDLPHVCDLPTGLGKTSVIPIWLITLASQGRRPGIRRLPRRLVYIVNRRTVVDQATDLVEGIRERLRNPQDNRWAIHKEVLSVVKRELQTVPASANNEEVFGVSTLRGELADNEEWKADPARPAIIVGTIDMIGSKLLFSGYGDGRYGRTHHTGLIGHDALIIHDEAHLTPAFSDLLRVVAQEQKLEIVRNGCRGSIARPIEVLELSATSRGSQGGSFALEQEDEEEQIVQDRLSATKRLYLHAMADDSIAGKIVELSARHEDVKAKLLIYVRSPELAQQVASALVKSLEKGADQRIALLTGTIRGHERDRLVKTNPVYRALLDPNCRVEKTVYLVSTSAGEVGIDLDADHLVCDLTTLDAGIQRLGRVNRRGGGERTARVDLVGNAPVGEKLSQFEKAIRKTLALVRLARRYESVENGIDVSPGNLCHLLKSVSEEKIEAAFSPTPDAPPLTDILLDAWSLTSVDKIPGRPGVEPFLNGLTHDPPETYVAWRREVSMLDNANVDESSLRDWFRTCRIEARERLRDGTNRVRKALAVLLKAHQKKDGGLDFRVVLLDERGEARWFRLSEITQKDFGLAFCTVVLPVEAGGLDSNGMLDPKALEPSEGFCLDVAEGATGHRRERWLHRWSADGDRYERLLTGETRHTLPTQLREKERLSLHQPEEAEEEAERCDLVLLVSPVESALENPETASARQSLTEHTKAIAAEMSAIAKRLGLPEQIQSALITAASWHDRGKDRAVWQRYARNESGTNPLAKSPKYLHPRALGGYRHEFGSLLEAMCDAGIQAHAERDLVLHLIAAHHGWARPHFKLRSFDHTRTTAENTDAATEAMRRFGRLQHRFGRWGLAWLESLLRCADIGASQRAAKSTNVRQPQEVQS